MKILQISTELVHSGAERIVYDLACYLKEQKQIVHVACVKDVRGSIGEWLEEKNIPVYWVDLNYKKPIQLVINIYKFIKFVKSENFDLVHAHQFHSNVLGRLTRLFGGPKVISTVHLVDKRFRPWHFLFDSWTAFLCAKEICVSKAVKEFTAYKAPFMKNKLTVIYNGIQFERRARERDLTPARLPDSLKKKFIFGAVGRLTHQKGFSYLIEAFAMLIDKKYDVGLIIIGDGPERKQLKKIIEEHALENCAFLLGYQKYPDPFYHEMDVFVMPSLYEGFGLVAVEAMHFCLPIIATNVDSLPEIIQDGVTGYLCPPENVKSLSAIMEKVFLNAGKSALVALEGQKFVHQAFPLSKMLKEHLDLYASELTVKNPNSS